jgi:type IV secretory pathway component VirB8
MMDKLETEDKAFCDVQKIFDGTSELASVEFMANLKNHQEFLEKYKNLKHFREALAIYLYE